MNKKKVIAAGHICLDITPVFPMNIQGDVNAVLQPGKLIQMGNVDVHTGGSVANTGLAMKMLGADVSLMGKIGTDAFGDMVINALEKYSVADGMIRDESSTTSYSVVLSIPGVDRIFLHHTGANDTFVAADLKKELLEEAALFHFGYPPLMEKMYENDGSGLVELLKTVKETGAAISLDMASVDVNSKAGKVNWYKLLSDAIPYVDFFVPSVEELCFMLDRPRFEEWHQRAKGEDITEKLDVEKDIEPLAEKCMELGCKVLMIKCGAKGMYFKTASDEILRGISDRVGMNIDAWGNKAWFENSYVPECILSGTGAGDTSIAAFLVAMLNGYTPERCVQLAAATGASCITSYDALSGLKSFDELITKIDGGWMKKSI